MPIRFLDEAPASTGTVRFLDEPAPPSLQNQYFNPEQQKFISIGTDYVNQQKTLGKPVDPNLSQEKLLSIGEGVQNLGRNQAGAQQAQENPTWEDVYAGQAAAGAVDFEQSLRVLGAALDDQLLNDENLGTIAQQEEYKQNFPQSEGMKRLAQSTGFLDTAGTLLGDIPGTLGPTLTRSLVQGAVPMIGGAAIGGATANVPGALVGTGAGAGVADAVQSFGDYLRSKNVDLRNPQAIKAALQDPEIKKEAFKYAGIRGLIIGATSALGGSVAGKVASLPAKNIIGRGAAIAGDVALQSGIEGGGEAAAQLATTGKINPSDVAAEAIVGLPLNAAETTIGGLHQSRQNKTVQVENVRQMKPIELRPTSDPAVATREAEILAKSQAMAPSTVDKFISGEQLPTAPTQVETPPESFAPAPEISVEDQARTFKYPHSSELEGIDVDVRKTRADTGEEVVETMDAKKAQNEARRGINRYLRLIDCLE